MSLVQEDPSIHADQQWTLLLNFSNIFNSVDRECLFRQVRAHIPLIAAWMETSYGAHLHLRLGDFTIPSCHRVQQGDPLSLLGFALILHPIIEKIKEEIPGLLINAWYLDDGTLSASADDLSAALAIIEEEGPRRGLHLNRSKSLLYIPEQSSSSHNPLPHDIPITRGGFILLGSPPTHCEQTMMARVEKIQDILARLPDIQDSQIQTTPPSVLPRPPEGGICSPYTCPPSHIKRSIAAFDNTMREAITDLTGGPLPDWSWLKASLPTSLGGLGIRCASTHAPAAYISSLDKSSHLIAGILS